MCGYEQQNCIEACFCRIAKDDLRVNSRNPRTTNLVAIKRSIPDFRRRHAHLGKRWSVSGTSCDKSQDEERESFDPGSVELRSDERATEHEQSFRNKFKLTD